MGSHCPGRHGHSRAKSAIRQEWITEVGVNQDTDSDPGLRGGQRPVLRSTAKGVCTMTQSSIRKKEKKSSMVAT